MKWKRRNTRMRTLYKQFMCVWKKGAKVEKIRSDNVHLNDTEIHKQKNGSTGMVLSRQSMKFINGHTIIHLLNAVY